jgi:hypothetical protein
METEVSNLLYIYIFACVREEEEVGNTNKRRGRETR